MLPRFLRVLWLSLCFVGSLAAAVAVTVNPSTATVNQGATKQFTATVTGSTNTGVTWSVTSGGGSISTSGLYTAPKAAGTFTVTATSKADTSKKATATVTVPDVVVTVSPATASVAQGTTRTFTATVTGAASTSVTWSTTSPATINSSGVFTAPGTAGTYTVTAKSVTNTARTGTATGTVPMKVTVSPTTATLNQGGTQTFTATVTGSTNKAVAWSASGGTITSAGVYTAPATPGTYTVTATTAAAPVASASAAVTVNGITVSVSPAAPVVAINGSQTFTATVNGTTNKAVTWTCSAGSITSAGVFTAPATIGACTVTATSVVDATKSASVNVAIVPRVSVAVDSSSVWQGAQALATATVEGTADARVTWSCSAGTIDANGMFTAPAAAGNVTLTATSVADPRAKGTATVTVAPVTIRIEPVNASQFAGYDVDLYAYVEGTLNPAATWSITSGGGSVVDLGMPDGYTPQARYRTPYSAGTAKVKATSVANPAKSATSTITIQANDQPVIRSFTATPATISAGGSTTLTADFGNGTGVVTPGSLALVAGQNLVQQPASSTAYKLTVTGSGGAINSEVATVGVRAPGRLLAAGQDPSTQFDPGLLGTVLDRSGRVLLAGGYIGTGLGPNRVERFDPATGLWSTVGNLLDPMLENASYTLTSDGKLWCLGGRQRFPGNWYYEYAAVFDPATGQTTELQYSPNIFGGTPTEPFSNYDHTATLLNDGRILLVGGQGLPPGTSWGYPSPRPEAYLWDPIQRYAVRTGDLHAARTGHTAVLLLDGRVLVSSTHAIDAEVYDPATGLFTVLTGVRGTPSLLPDGRVLLVQAGSGHYLWNPATGTTTSQSPVQEFGLENPTITLSDGRLYGPATLHSGGEFLNPADGTRWTLRDKGGLNDGFLRGSPVLLPDGSVFYLVQPNGTEAQARRMDPEATLKVSPAVAQQNVGLPLAFLAQGGSVTWTASGGSVAADGSFTASQPGLYCVTATTSGGLQSHAWVRMHPAVSVTIPSFVLPGGKLFVNAGVPVPFTAVVRHHPDTRVTWAVQEGPAAGSITTAGVFTGAAAGVVHIVATSLADPGKSATYTLTVAAPVCLSISPASLAVAVGDTATFTAQEPSGQTAVNWYFDGTFVYQHTGLTTTAPMIPGTCTVRAVSAVDPTVSATATLTVVPVDSLSITPATRSVVILQRTNFQAFATSSLGTKEVTDKVTWSSPGGTFSESFKGEFTASSTPGTFPVQASLGAVATATASVTVQPIDSLRLSPAKIVLGPGERLYFTATIQTANGRQTCPLPVTFTCTGGRFYDSLGGYTAASESGTSTVTVTINGTSISASAKVMVVPLDAFSTNEGGTQTLRGGFSMTRLLDGKVLIAGGGNNTAELYDPATKTFTTLAATMSKSRTDHSATLLPDGRVLLTGGETTGTGPAAADLFDPATQTFTATAGLPLYRRMSHYASLRPDGKVLLAGGTDGFASTSLEGFDPATGLFVPLGNLGKALSSAEGAMGPLADGGMLFAAGYQSPYQIAPNEVLSFPGGSTRSVGVMNFPHGRFSLLPGIDDRIWALGDSLGSQISQNQSFEWFAPANNQFIVGPTLNRSSQYGFDAVEQADGSAYLFERAGRSGLRFDFASGECDPMRDLPETSQAANYGKAVLLPTGEVLRVGYYNNGLGLRGSTLILADVTPGLVVLPRRLTLLAGASWPFQASSTGLGSAGFNWTVMEGASAGSVSALGVYTAPYAPGTYHVVATSKADGSVQAQAAVTVVQPGAQVTVAPALVQVAPSGTFRFQASVAGVSNTGVTWTASTGTIAADGAFTAPATAQTLTVTATSVADPSRSATATVVVATGGVGGGGGGGDPVPKPILLNFRADTLVVLAGRPAILSWDAIGAYQLTLFANGAPQDVTGRTSLEVRPTSTTSYYLYARNPYGTASSANLTISVSTQPVSIGITPTTATLFCGQTMKFGWSLTAPTNRMTWSASAGSIQPDGSYTAPNAPGSATVTLTSVDDPSKSASAAVTVKTPQIRVQPKSMSIYRGESYRFGYAWDWPWGVAVTWAATPTNLGTLAADGTFTASAVGQVRITVACASDPNLFDVATLDIVEPSLQILPGPIFLRVGETFQFRANPASPVPSWRVVEPAGGTIDATGKYTTPANSGVFHVEAAAPGRTAQVQVTVLAGGGGGGGVVTGTGTSGVGIALSPAVADIDAGTYLSLNADISGSDNLTVNWSLRDNPEEAEVDASGVFRASRPGTYTVVATAAADGSAQAEATVFVRSSLTPTPTEPPGGGAWWGYSVTPLKNGKILLAGGQRVIPERVEDTTFESAAYLFDPETKTYSPTGSLRTARGWHHAVALDDGRVLIAGGSARWLDPWDPFQVAEAGLRQPRLRQLPFAEVYDPVTGTFQELPSQAYPDVPFYTGGSLNSRRGPLQGPGLMRSNHPGGAAVKLADGRVCIAGGASGWLSLLGTAYYNESIWSRNPPSQWEPWNSLEGWDLFSPAAGTFDLSNLGTPWAQSSPGLLLSEGWFLETRDTIYYAAGMGQDGSLVVLPDGKLLLGVGWSPNLTVCMHAYPGARGTPVFRFPDGWYSFLLDPADPKFEQWVPTPPGRPLRGSAVFTRLSDGRVLSSGGLDLGTPYDRTPSAEGVYYATSGLADLFDPATRTWSPTGALHKGRKGHAATLLPTGQVMVTGGYQVFPDGTWAPVDTVELFDPDSGTWTVKERLDYGILDPKIAMQADGGQFVAGLFMDLGWGTAPAMAAGVAAGDRERRLPAELRPTGSTQAWLEKLRRIQREQPEILERAGIASSGTQWWLPTSNFAQSGLLIGGSISEVRFSSGILASLAKQTIVAPHWKKGRSDTDGEGSKHPAVYLMAGAGADALQAKVDLFGVVSFQDGPVKLIGSIPGAVPAGGGAAASPLKMEGTFTMVGGANTVSMRFTNLPSGVNWFRGDATWKLVLPQGTVVNLPGSTRLEVFTVLRQPTTLFDLTGGVWVEVLRLIGEKASILGANTSQQALQQVASYLHWGHGLKYETIGGASQYGLTGSGTGVGFGFELKNYLVRANPKANCYDQAAAIQTFASALGIQCDWLFLEPFGFINPTHLLGIPGLCNNPFFEAPWVPISSAIPLVTWDDPGRTAFVNHAFIGFNGSIFDACAGPHLGTETPVQYLQSSIDTRPRPGSNPGTASQIQSMPGVEKIQ